MRCPSVLDSNAFHFLIYFSTVVLIGVLIANIVYLNRIAASEEKQAASRWSAQTVSSVNIFFTGCAVLFLIVYTVWLFRSKGV